MIWYHTVIHFGLHTTGTWICENVKREVRKLEILEISGTNSRVSLRGRHQGGKPFSITLKQRAQRTGLIGKAVANFLDFFFVLGGDKPTNEIKADFCWNEVSQSHMLKFALTKIFGNLSELRQSARLESLSTFTWTYHQHDFLWLLLCYVCHYPSIRTSVFWWIFMILCWISYLLIINLILYFCNSMWNILYSIKSSHFL